MKNGILLKNICFAVTVFSFVGKEIKQSNKKHLKQMEFILFWHFVAWINICCITLLIHMTISYQSEDFISVAKLLIFMLLFVEVPLQNFVAIFCPKISSSANFWDFVFVAVCDVLLLNSLIPLISSRKNITGLQNSIIFLIIDWWKSTE